MRGKKLVYRQVLADARLMTIAVMVHISHGRFRLCGEMNRVVLWSWRCRRSRRLLLSGWF